MKQHSRHHHPSHKEIQPHFWLSFADDTGFLGACIVPGETLFQAVKEAYKRKINPGGEVLGGGPFPFHILDDYYRGKIGVLLQKEDIPDGMKVTEWPSL